VCGFHSRCQPSGRRHQPLNACGRMGTAKGMPVRTLLPSLPCGLLLFLLGCGGSPATPSSPASPPPVVPPVTASLPPGAYYFVVSQGSNSIPAPGGGTFNTWICLGVGSYPTTVKVPVTVEGEGGNYHARAVSGSLLLNITVSGSAASGTVQGNADDGAFSISVQGTEPAGVTGSVTSDHTVDGTVLGNITLMGPQGSGSCSPANWSLMPR